MYQRSIVYLILGLWACHRGYSQCKPARELMHEQQTVAQTGNISHYLQRHQGASDSVVVYGQLQHQAQHRIFRFFELTDTCVWAYSCSVPQAPNLPTGHYWGYATLRIQPHNTVWLHQFVPDNKPVLPDSGLLGTRFEALRQRIDPNQFKTTKRYKHFLQEHVPGLDFGLCPWRAHTQLLFVDTQRRYAGFDMGHLLLKQDIQWTHRLQWAVVWHIQLQCIYWVQLRNTGEFLE